MDKSLGETKLQQVLDRIVDNKKVFGTSVCVENGNSSLMFTGSAGNLVNESQYFIASTTKLYITTIILILREQNKLNLDDNTSKYFEKQVLKGLLVFKGVDYSGEITIRQLLAHTSGLPDYFQQKKSNGVSLQDQLTSGLDQSWTFEMVIDEVKKMKPSFKPGEKGRALYSDTNYQLLGKIIEAITGNKLSNVLQEFVFAPLGLKQTYLYEDSQDKSPATMYFKQNPLSIPLAMSSFGPDGGIVSTAAEQMTFIKAFFNGQLFPIDYFNEIKNWNKIFFPLEYGVGIARFKLPRIFSPFKPMPELLGHSGLSGAFAYYSPEKDIYLAGTVNQINNPDTSYKLMLELLGQA